jgi:uncharacterized membrane protein YgcG
MRHLLLMLGVILIALPAAAGDIKIFHATNPITIDGQAADWSDKPLSYLVKEKLSMGVRYDSTMLYLLFNSQDEATMRTIMMGGITVWLDSTGSRDKLVGVRYLPPLPDRPVDQDDDRRLMMREQKRGLSVIEGSDNTWLTDSTSQHVKATIDRGRSGLLIEMQIPLRYTDSTDYAANVRSGDKLGIGIEIGGGSKSRPPGEMDTMGGGRPGGGMRSGGGRPGGRGSDSDRPQMETINEWIKVTIGG